jgi:hypothetical protein|tara:strand:+ start:8397 stop:8819 length:423 start_codon:yes stop_codon:yes gene_type:complete
VPLLEAFEANHTEAIAPVTPNFKVAGIKRGSDDGNLGSCSDFGFIIFKLSGSYPPQGYIFERVSGEFEDRLFEPVAVMPSQFIDDNSSFTFVWLDGSSNEQEPINITVSIVAVNQAGERSKAQFLELRHPYNTLPWWRFW